MASELQLKWTETGITAYAIVYNSTGQAWNTAGSAYETFAVANIADYDTALTEINTTSRWYVGDMPSGAASAAYSISYHKQAGGSPAVTDQLIGTENYRPNAAAVTTIQTGLATPTNITAASGVALTAAYDAAKTAATQASVDDLPTNSELTTALGTADDAVLAAIAALNNLSSAGAQSAAAAALTAYGAALEATAQSILTDTNELQTDWVNGGRLDLLIDAILADTTSLNDTVLPEIATATDIPATPTPRQAWMLFYMWLRNNTQDTATLRKVLNDAGTVVLQGTMADNGTTFTQGKLGNP